MSSRPPQSQATRSFGALLRRYRAEAGLTQEALAERAGLSVRGISDLERELIRHPRQDTLQLLIDGLGLTESAEEALRAAALRPVPGLAPSVKVTFGGFGLLAPTPLFGRDREIRHVTSLLMTSGVRWVTLTGPGGVGKSRLAHAVAAELAAGVNDGITWVELSPVREEALVLPTVAQALGLPEVPGVAAADRLATAIADRKLLLVVDNLEQVTGSAPALSGLLATCPNLQILATSRVRLRLRAEHVVTVPPLDLPPGEGEGSSLERLAANPAMALFVARAAAVRQEFTLTPGNAAAVAAICRRLDGLPLAIELAAARSAMLDPGSLLRQLEHRLSLLTEGFTDAPERQRTMRDAIAWSHDLLPPFARTLFRRLGVFIGGFDIAAMSAVVPMLDVHGDTRTWLDQAETSPSLRLLDALQVLVDASLVLRTGLTEGEPRYSILETLREFALEELGAAGEEPAARNAHAAYFATVADGRLKFPDYFAEDPAILAEVERDISNLRSALEWVVDRGPAETGLALAHGLGLVAIFLGYQAEALMWLDRFLDQDGPDRGELQTRTLIVRSMVVRHRGRDEDAATDAREALVRIDEHDPIGRASALYMLGTARRSVPELETALALSQNHPGGHAMAAMTLMALSLYSVTIDHDQEQAIIQVEEGLALLGPGPTVGHTIMLGNLASLVFEAGDVRRAADLDRQGLLLNRQGRSLQFLITNFRLASEISLAAAQPDLAARLLGASITLEARIGAMEEWFNEPFLDLQVQSLQNALGEDAFAAALAEGRALPLDDALDEALLLLDDVADAPARSAGRSP